MLTKNKKAPITSEPQHYLPIDTLTPITFSESNNRNSNIKLNVSCCFTIYKGLNTSGNFTTANIDVLVSPNTKNVQLRYFLTFRA